MLRSTCRSWVTTYALCLRWRRASGAGSCGCTAIALSRTSWLSLCLIWRSSRGVSRTTHMSHGLHTYTMTHTHHCLHPMVVPGMEVFSRCVTFAYHPRTTYAFDGSYTWLLSSHCVAWYGGLFEVRHICIWITNYIRIWWLVHIIAYVLLWCLIWRSFREMCHDLHIWVTNYIHTSRRIHSIAHFLSWCPISRSYRGMSQTTHVRHELHTYIMTRIHHCTLPILVPDMDVFQRCVADYACESRTTYIHHDSYTSLRTCYFGARYGGLVEENYISRHTCLRHELRIITHTYLNHTYCYSQPIVELYIERCVVWVCCVGVFCGYVL